MLQVNVSKSNYNSYIVIYITWLRLSWNVFTAVNIGAIKMYVIIYPMI